MQLEHFCNKYAEKVRDLEEKRLGWHLPYTTELKQGKKSGGRGVAGEAHATQKQKLCLAPAACAPLHCLAGSAKQLVPNQ